MEMTTQTAGETRAMLTRDRLLEMLPRYRWYWGYGPDVRRWVDATPGTPEALWGRCERGDHLLWLAAWAGVDRRQLVLTACAIARTALRHVAAGEQRPQQAIETARPQAR